MKANQELIKAGHWVELTRIVLPAAKRAPNLPPETKKTDLVLKVRGFLLEDAVLGAEAQVCTLAEREQSGILTEAHPRFPHDFGDPVPELLQIGRELRAEVREILQQEREANQ
jgi:hypothetical protein